MRRLLKMYQYGGTIGYTRYPLFRIPGCEKDQMLPKPVAKSWPYKGIGHSIMEETEWFVDLVKDVEDMVVRHLLVVGTKEPKHILKWCHFFKNRNSRMSSYMWYFFQSVCVGWNWCKWWENATSFG